MYYHGEKADLSIRDPKTSNFMSDWMRSNPVDQSRYVNSEHIHCPVQSETQAKCLLWCRPLDTLSPLCYNP